MATAYPAKKGLSPMDVLRGDGFDDKRHLRQAYLDELELRRLTQQTPASAAELSGGRVNYYLLRVDHPQREDQQPYTAECEDLIEAAEMTPDEANIFKEIWRSANARKGKAKQGHTAVYGAQKIVHYANRLLRKHQREV